MAKKIPNSSVVPSLVGQIINADRENIAHLLQEQCLKVVSSDMPLDAVRNKSIIVMIKEISEDGDSVELMLAAQFVALSLSGMDTLSGRWLNSKGQGMQLIRLAQFTLETLCKYRNNKKHSLDQQSPISTSK